MLRKAGTANRGTSEITAALPCCRLPLSLVRPVRYFLHYKGNEAVRDCAWGREVTHTGEHYLGRCGVTGIFIFADALLSVDACSRE